MFLDRLFFLCVINDISLINLCGKIGVSSSASVHWRHGSIPRMKNLQKIASFFHVSVDYLLGYTDDRSV